VMGESVLVVRDLVCRYAKNTVEPLRGISFSVRRGETFAIAGESGSGKSTLARAVAGLHRPASGSVALAGGPTRRGRLQMVFQDPGGSLNPRLRVRSILAEPIALRNGKRPDEHEITALLARVGLPAAAANRYPHEFSGGERQRIAIARAVSTSPDLIVCDEPTSALDASAQSRILNLLADLREQYGMACLLFSHDLAVISQLADRVGVLYDGQLCETGETQQVLTSPVHPHTRALRDAAL
jgi:peptide/nickel transport system ATP-binding protein